MDRIVFRDLKRQYQALKDRIDRAVLDIMIDGQFIGGEPVVKLEDLLAEYAGVKHCITCANGTDALQLALMALGIGPGDAVFIPDFTFFATGEIIPQVGATPVFVDVDARTFNMDPESLRQAVKAILDVGELKPAAVIPVDLFGLPADYPGIMEVATDFGLLVIEDAAQGFGGAIGSKRCCSFGHVATTSFFPAKPLGCYGDGGAVFTNDTDLATLIGSLKVHGKGQHKYENIRIGMNSRLDTIQAGILMVKLQAFIDDELAMMATIHNQYTKELSDYVEVPFIPDGYQTCHAQYTIKTVSAENRDQLQRHLDLHGIPTMIYYPIPMHQQLAFAKIGVSPVSLEQTRRLCETVLSLPIHPYLTQPEIDMVVSRVKEGIKSSRMDLSHSSL
ncbi:MAG: DegT/DnrJ/EryC1/StrS family aminotransferase [Saccharofermentanales bacterium]